MALYDYKCDDCQYIFQDVFQEIGSEPIDECPHGHHWTRLISKVRIDPSFKGYESLSPQMETFWETGDPNLAFPPGKPADDAFTLEDLTPEMMQRNIAPDSPKDWATKDD